MPPCAQTECERFTGTIEKRSTGRPASAMRIVVMRPARPPPTTIVRGDAIPTPGRPPGWRTPSRTWGEEHQGKRPCQALRTLPDGDAPGDAERPQSVREVEH